MGRVVGGGKENVRWIREKKGRVQEGSGEVQRERGIIRRNWTRLGGENSRSKGFWGRGQANRCFRRCRGEWFCTGGMVARQIAPGCARCVRTEKGSARTKRARAEAPRTGLYVICAWNVWRTGRTGRNRAQGSIFADGGWYNHTLSLGIERKHSPVKRGFLLVQHYVHDLDVLRYLGHPESSWKGSTKWASLT